MAYSSGMLRHRVTIQNRTNASAGRFGLDSAGVEWKDEQTVWAAVDFVKGLRAMREGAIDAYAVVMVRMRWTSIVNMRSRILYNGITYQILPETFHADYYTNTIQFNAQAIVTDVQPISSSEL